MEKKKERERDFHSYGIYISNLEDFFFDRLVTKCYFIIIIDCFYIALFSTIFKHLLMLIQENSGD